MHQQLQIAAVQPQLLQRRLVIDSFYRLKLGKMVPGTYGAQRLVKACDGYAFFSRLRSAIVCAQVSSRGCSICLNLFAILSSLTLDSFSELCHSDMPQPMSLPTKAG